MLATTLKNRLDKRYTGSKNAIAYRVMVDLLENVFTPYSNSTNMLENINTLVNNKLVNPIIRPVYVSGVKRFASNQDHTYAISKLLDLLGVKYESGNDAPRGGLTGNYIKILTKIEY